MEVGDRLQQAGLCLDTAYTGIGRGFFAQIDHEEVAGAIVEADSFCFLENPGLVHFLARQVEKALGGVDVIGDVADFQIDLLVQQLAFVFEPAYVRAPRPPCRARCDVPAAP